MKVVLYVYLPVLVLFISLTIYNINLARVVGIITLVTTYAVLICVGIYYTHLKKGT